MSRTLHAPRSATSTAKAVLTEYAVASVRLIWPLRVPSSLRTAHVCPLPMVHLSWKSDL